MSKLDFRFVRQYPALMATPVWEDDAAFKLYYFLLYKANHEEQCLNGLTQCPDEVVISRKTASSQLRWSIHKYQRHLKTLENLGIIVTQRVSMGTKIKILDFLSADDAFISEDETENTGAALASLGGYDSSNAGAAIAPCEGYDGSSAEAKVAYYEGYDSSNVGTATAPYRGYDRPTAGAMIAPDRGYDGYNPGVKTTPDRGYDGYNAEATVAPNIDIYKYNIINNRDRDTMALQSIASFKEPEDFHRLWLAYPADRRYHREEAARLFHEAILHGATFEAIMDALEADKRSEAWLTDGGKYIPGIVKWLEKETWRNYLCTEPLKEDEEHWVSR